MQLHSDSLAVVAVAADEVAVVEAADAVVAAVKTVAVAAAVTTHALPFHLQRLMLQ